MWFRKNVVMSRQVKNMVAVLAFFYQQKGSVSILSIFAKNVQSNLALVLVLILESKGPDYVSIVNDPPCAPY